MTQKLQPNIKELEKAFDGKLDLVLFFLAWVKNCRNATKAYLELNPNVDTASAAVLGSRQLKKVNIEAVLTAYDLGPETYYQQLSEGVRAERRDQFSGEMYPDHKTRKDYHDKLGRLLGIEQDNKLILAQQINIGGEMGVKVTEYDPDTTTQETT